MITDVARWGKTRQLLAVGVGFLVWAQAPTVALAQEFPEPQDRNYTSDLYRGQAMGSARIVGMGGAATAMAQGSSGMIANPASPAVRATTSHDTWDWDFHIDSMSPSLGSDHDNNGIATSDRSFAPSVTSGLVVQYKDWGFGVGLIGLVVENAIPDELATDGIGNRWRTEATVVQFAVARHFLDGDVVAGLSARSAFLEVFNIGETEEQTLLKLSGVNLETGAVWKPRQKSLRLGASLRLPVVSDETEVEACDPLDCAGYILPNKIKVPWEARVGIASRHSKLAWNRTAKGQWVDEQALTWALDLVVTGKTFRGAGLEAFGVHKLQPSGRKHSFSVRGGVDYERSPGRLRVRGGRYYEPGRFKDASGDDIGGRMHLTLGTDVRVWQFGFWGDLYRVRLSLTADVAENFANSGISFGFWH